MSLISESNVKIESMVYNIYIDDNSNGSDNNDNNDNNNINTTHNNQVRKRIF